MDKYIAFMQGVIEFRCSVTTHHDDWVLRHYYDLGRELAHRVTFRRF